MGARARCPHCSQSLHIPETDVGEGDVLTDVGGFAAVARSSQIGRIKFACHHCGKRLAAPIELAGKPAQCLGCGRPIEVPHIDVDQTLRLEGEESHESPGALLDDDGPDVTPVTIESDLDVAVREPTGLAAAALPEAPVEPQPAPASQEPLVEVPTAGPVTPAKKPAPGWAMWAIIGAALLATVIFVLAMAIDWSGDSAEGPDDGPGETDIRDRPDEPSGASTGRSNNGSGTVAIMPVMVRSVTPSAFAGGGYRPAPRGKEYWRVLARVLGGSGGVAFDSFGPAVTLTIGEDQYEAMGVVTGRSVFPLTGHQMRITIQAGQEGYVTFLFEMPVAEVGSDRLAGRLDIYEVGGCDIWGPSAPSQDAALTPGRYVEVLPRNLPLESANPAVAEIRQAGEHALVVAEQGGRMSVSLPAVSLSGVVTANGFVILRGPGGEIDAALRVVESRVVLYLGGDEPYAHLTFASAEQAEAMAADALPLHDAGVGGLAVWASELPASEAVIITPATPTGQRPPPASRTPGGTIFD